MVDFMSSSRAGRTTLTMAKAREVLGNIRTLDYEDGHRATCARGGILLTDEGIPKGAARLPANWRNVLARASWFAVKHRPGTNDPRACVMLDGSDAYAGSNASAVAIPLLFGGAGVSLPVFLPEEIAWHKIPGSDGASLWEQDSGYVVQTDAGIRVFAVRETARLGTYPWHAMFQAYNERDTEPTITFGLVAPRPTAYTRYDIEYLASWVDALESAPSDVLELIPGRTEMWCKETRDFESPWPYSAVSFPATVHGEPPADSVWTPAVQLLLAFQALLSHAEAGVIAIRSPVDNVFIFGGDATAIVAPVGAVRPEPLAADVVAPPDPDTKVRTRPTGKPGGGGGNGAPSDETKPRSAIHPPGFRAVG